MIKKIALSVGLIVCLGMFNAVAENVVTDSSFEKGAKGWRSNRKNTRRAVDNKESHSGSHSMRITGDNTQAGGIWRDLGAIAVLRPTSAKFSYWGKIANAKDLGTKCMTMMIVLDNGKKVWFSTNLKMKAEDAGKWVKKESEYTAPDGAKIKSIRVYLLSYKCKSPVWFDDISVDVNIPEESFPEADNSTPEKDITVAWGKKLVFEDKLNGGINITPWLRGNNQMGGYKLIKKNPDVEHAPYMFIARNMLRANLSQKINTDNSAGFRLKVKAMHRGDYSVAIIWLLNHNGTEGYGFSWNSGSKGPNSVMDIRKWDSSTKPGFQKLGKLLGRRISLKGEEKKPPFGEFKLTWIAATGKLTLKSLDKKHGPREVSIIDKSFNTFSTIYLHGNGTYYDDIYVYKLEK